MNMYEARQNKEKVSRRIQVEGKQFFRNNYINNAINKQISNKAHDFLVLQRQSKRQELLELISWALSGGRNHNLSSALKAIYHYLIDTAKTNYTKNKDDLADMKQFLIEQGLITENDVAFLTIKIKGKLSDNKDDKDSIDSINESITNVYDRINSTYAHHIFQGDFDRNGKPTGFHSTVDGSQTHEVYGKVTPIDTKYGTYQQSVRTKTKFQKKGIQSSFFPNDMTHEDIIRGIISVLILKSNNVNYTINEKFKGMPLIKKGNTIFPSGGGNLIAE